MSGQTDIISYFKEKLAAMDLPFDLYHIGETFADTPFVIQQHDGHWFYGDVERGKFRPSARFEEPVDAVEYLIFQMERQKIKPFLPDWSDYAARIG